MWMMNRMTLERTIATAILRHVGRTTFSGDLDEIAKVMEPLVEDIIESYARCSGIDPDLDLAHSAARRIMEALRRVVDEVRTAAEVA